MEGDQSEFEEDSEMEATIDPPKAKGMARREQPTPPAPGSPYLVFPLTKGNTLEVRLSRKVSAEDFQRIKMIIELAESSFVEDDSDDE